MEGQMATKTSTSQATPKAAAPKAGIVQTIAKATRRAPTKVASKSTESEPISPKIRVARRIDPSFPATWKFDGKLADRLKAAQEHGATPKFLEALYAAEGDQMRRQLEKIYSDQFGS